MKSFIYYLSLFIQLFSARIYACNKDFIVNTSHGKIYLKTAISTIDKTKGLSGVKKINNSHGMFFFYKNTKQLSFWMPNTFINLDIFFIDKNLKIIAIERNLKAHPGRKPVPEIQQTKSYLAKYVMELNTLDPISSKLKVNDKLSYFCSNYFLQTKQGIHLKK